MIFTPCAKEYYGNVKSKTASQKSKLYSTVLVTEPVLYPAEMMLLPAIEHFTN